MNVYCLGSYWFHDQWHVDSPYVWSRKWKEGCKVVGKKESCLNSAPCRPFSNDPCAEPHHDSSEVTTMNVTSIILVDQVQCAPWPKKDTCLQLDSYGEQLSVQSLYFATVDYRKEFTLLSQPTRFGVSRRHLRMQLPGMCTSTGLKRKYAPLSPFLTVLYLYLCIDHTRNILYFMRITFWMEITWFTTWLKLFTVLMIWFITWLKLYTVLIVNDPFVSLSVAHTVTRPVCSFYLMVPEVGHCDNCIPQSSQIGLFTLSQSADLWTVDCEQLGCMLPSASPWSINCKSIICFLYIMCT